MKTAEAQNGQPRVLWPHGINIVLGAWLISSAATLGHSSTKLAWSDSVCGALLIALSALALKTHRVWVSWVIAVLGLWLMSAPLIFWAPMAATYNNNTLIGALVVVFAVLVPGTPGAKSDTGPDIPPGWSYNPSMWAQRSPIVALALVGFFISRYMAAFQLGHIDTIWEPFFHPGTRAVLESDVSKAFPVSDAGLGALSYLIDALAGVVGGTRRWRTMPWMVIVFGVFIIPPGVVSIVLVILQPVSVGAWCTLCLLASAAMLMMVPPALDEVIATGQLLQRNWRAGRGFWRTFWHGETHQEIQSQPGGAEESSPEQNPLPLREMVAGVVVFSTPWNLLLSTLLGIWLMAAPAVLEVSGAAATSSYVVGALVATFAIIAGAEPARSVRYLNALFGIWLCIAPWVLDGSTHLSTWSNVAVGIALIALSIPRGRLKERYGGWERFMI